MRVLTALAAVMLLFAQPAAAQTDVLDLVFNASYTATTPLRADWVVDQDSTGDFTVGTNLSWVLTETDTVVGEYTYTEITTKGSWWRRTILGERTITVTNDVTHAIWNVHRAKRADGSVESVYWVYDGESATQWLFDVHTPPLGSVDPVLWGVISFPDLDTSEYPWVLQLTNTSICTSPQTCPWGRVQLDASGQPLPWPFDERALADEALAMTAP